MPSHSGCFPGIDLSRGRFSQNKNPLAAELESLVVKTARNYVRPSEVEEFRQVGYLALLEARVKYQGPSEGFEAYAQPRIDRAVRAAAGRSYGGGWQPPPRLETTIEYAQPGEEGPTDGDDPTLDYEAVITAADLTEREREYLRLRLDEGLSQSETADRLGITTRTAHRVRTAVRAKVCAEAERSAPKVFPDSADQKAGKKLAYGPFGPLERNLSLDQRELRTELEHERAFTASGYVSPLGRICATPDHRDWAADRAAHLNDTQWKAIESGDAQADTLALENDWPTGGGQALHRYLHTQARYYENKDIADPRKKAIPALVRKGILRREGESLVLTPFAHAIHRECKRIQDARAARLKASLMRIALD